MKITVNKILRILRLDFAERAAKEIENRHTQYAADIVKWRTRRYMGRYLTKEELDRSFS
jgi:hypothetical protein